MAGTSRVVVLAIAALVVSVLTLTGVIVLIGLQLTDQTQEDTALVQPIEPPSAAADTTAGQDPEPSPTAAPAPEPLVVVPDPEPAASSAEREGATAGEGDTDAGTAPTVSESAADPEGASGPAAGVRLTVVGVDSDDVLNVRDEPLGNILATIEVAFGEVGCEDIISRRDDDADVVEIVIFLSCEDLIATGASRQHRTGLWHEISVAGVVGWVHSAYVAQIGSGRMVERAEVESQGGLVEGDSLVEIAFSVAEVTLGDLQDRRRVVTIAPGTWEGVSDAAVDVLGYDGTVAGYRVHVFATPGYLHATDSEDLYPPPDFYELLSARVTELCASPATTCG